MMQKDFSKDLELAAKGDEAAIARLYNETYSDMYHLALYLSRSAEAAEDILQESYISAIANLGNLRDLSSFSTWLKRIVINEWHEYKRRNRHSGLFSSENGEEGMPEPVSQELLQEQIEKKEQYAEIWREVNLLPENQRICMLLFYYEDMSIEEIAQALHIPQGSVKSRLHYGREKLRRRLGNSELFSGRTFLPLSESGSAGGAAGNAALLSKILAALSLSDSAGTAAAAAGGHAGGGLLLKAGVWLAAMAVSAGAAGGALHLAHRADTRPAKDTAATTTAAAVATTAVTSATVSTSAASSTSVTASGASAAVTTTATAAPAVMSFEFRAVSGGVSLIRYTGTERNVVIPAAYDGSPVVHIGDGAFQDCAQVGSVSVPSSVAAVESNAFRGCKNLTRLTLGSGVRSVGAAAFADCDRLSSVSVPGNVGNVGIYAFAYCDSLTSVSIAEGVSVINYNAFFGCPNLRLVTIPASVSVIGSDAFAGASPALTLRVADGSAAHQYAEANGLYYEWM